MAKTGVRVLLFLSCLAIPAGGSSVAVRIPTAKGSSQRPRLKSVHLAGRVLLPDGSPAAGARIFIHRVTRAGSREPEEIRAGPDGRFSRRVTTWWSPSFSRLWIRWRGRRIQTHAAPGQVDVAALLPGRGFGWWRYVATGKPLKRLTLRLTPCVEATGRLLKLEGNPVAGHALGITSLDAAFGRGAGRSLLWDAGLLPEEALRSLFSATTDAEGRFHINGLPQGVQANVQLADGLALAPGSARPIVTDATDRVDAGLFIAFRPATIRARVTDRLTGRPVNGARIQIVPLTASRESLHTRTRSAGPDTLVTGRGGEAAGRGYPTGSYQLFVNGQARKLIVAEGESVEVGDLRVRPGPLRVRLRDSGGRAAAGLRVSVQLHRGVPGAPETMLPFGIRWKPARGRTDARGRLDIFPFPESASMTLRATRGNDAVEWTGSPEAIRGLLELQLRRGALVSVSGRLVDPKRRPVAAEVARLIQWQDAPRVDWRFNARLVRVDARGSFRVDGLPRGEAFSILAPEWGSGSNGQFEGPRFVTASSGELQHLGDVVVHPQRSAAAGYRSYGIESGEQLARLFGLIPSPDAAALAEARRALRCYNAAIEARDVAAVHALTSRASSAWHEHLRDFLLYADLTRQPATSEEALQPVRFVPRFGVAYELASGSLRRPGSGFDLEAAARDLESNPRWVFLASERMRRISSATVLRCEAGGWRVVATGRPLFASSFFFGAPPLASSSDPPTPPPPNEAARLAAQRYLECWSIGLENSMRMLTSPLSSLHAPDLRGFQQLLAGRLDDGACPVRSGEAVAVRGIVDLSAGQLAWLARYVERSGLFTERRGGVRTPKDFPSGFAKRGDLAAFQYEANGGTYLMLLVRQQGKWQVLEPALPM